MPTFAIAFSGHRPNRLPADKDQLAELQNRILHELQRLHKYGYDTVYCGMAEGADRLCYDAVLCNNIFNPDIDKIYLHCALPYAAASKSKSSMNRADANCDIPFADEVTVISQRYHPGCFHKRNRFMVDNADILLAVYDGNGKGGTAYTIEYAQKQGKTVILIHPCTLEQTILPCKEPHSKAPQA